jgi:hypothetical protein
MLPGESVILESDSKTLTLTSHRVRAASSGHTILAHTGQLTVEAIEPRQRRMLGTGPGASSLTYADV